MASDYASFFPKTTQVEEDPKKKSAMPTGIFGDIFDMLSRPGNAVRTGIDYATDNDSATNFVKGLGEGITGKTSTNTAQILAKHGVDGWQGAVAGFVGDVATDPLTYLGIKGTKGMGKEESLLAALKTGAVDNVDTIAADIMAKNPTRVGLTVAGKKIGSVAVPDIGQKAVEKLLGSATDRRLPSKMFSRDAELPLGLSNMNRVIDSAHSSKFDDFRRSIQDVYLKDLSPTERAQITSAIEKGHKLAALPVENANARLKTLADYQDLTQRIQDDAFVQEGKLGYHKLKPGASGDLVTDYADYNPNYVYKYFEKPPADLTREGKAAMTLDEAEAAGYKPVRDVHDLLDLKMAQHHRNMARGTLIRDAIEKFGLDADQIKKLPKDSPLHDQFRFIDASKLKSPVAKQFGQGKMVPEFVRKSLDIAEGTFGSSSTGSQVLKNYDKVLNEWKFLNTALPGTQIRNMFGDYLMNLADGVYKPSRYGQAVKVLKDVGDNHAGELLQVADPLALKVPSSVGNSTIKIGGKNMGTNEVWELFGKSGAKSGIMSAELNRALNESEKLGLTNLYTKTRSKVGDVADQRENIFRMAHFVDQLDKHVTAGKSLDSAAELASKSVRKFNIDYGSLSTFEKDVARRVIPFYTYMRKATPLNMELLFTKPGFMALYPKGRDLMQGVLGTTDENGEPIIPSWITDMAPVRVARAKEESRNGFEKLISRIVGAKDNESAFVSTTTGTTPFDTLKLPFDPLSKLAQGDVGGAIRSPIANLTQMVTPAIKDPVEITTGKSMFTGAPIEGVGGWANWTANQLGPTRVGAKIAGGNVGGTLLNAGLGIPVQVASTNRQAGEFYKAQAAAAAKTHQDRLTLARSRFSDWDSLTPTQQARKLARMRTPAGMGMSPELKAQQKYVQDVLGR